ncbi:MAG: phosphotransferase [Candidatus Methanofastidiosia archaeon]
MKEKSFLQKIKEEFPEIEWKTYRYLTQGWDHVIIILDETIVFRAPKDSFYRNELKNEIQLLHYLRKKVNVGIPDYIYVSRDESFAGYNLVKGQELTASRFQQLSAFEKESAANQLAGFITTLHATPESILKKYRVKTQDQEEMYKELVRDTRALLYPRFSKKYIQFIEEYFEELRTALGRDYPYALVHNDLTSEHILWDAQSRQINIIDFSDRSFGDPAIDFTGLREYGPAFTTRVFELYEGKKDEQMLHRSELYFKRVPLYVMKDSLLGYPCTFEEGYEALKKRFKA